MTATPLLALARIDGSPASSMAAAAALAETFAESLERHWVPRFSDSERQRLERFTRPQRRAQFIAAHALLRLAIQHAWPVGATSVRCEVDRDGRPWIATPAATAAATVAAASAATPAVLPADPSACWQVSVSHSGAYAAVLLERGTAAIGVDIERMSAERDILAIVRAACGVDAGSRDQAYVLWAVHEARLKAATTRGLDTGEWHTSYDGHAIAVAGTRRAPQCIEVFALSAGGTATRTSHRVEWSGVAAG